MSQSLRSRLIGGFGGAGGTLVCSPLFQLLLGFELPFRLLITFESLGFVLIIVAIVLHMQSHKIELEKKEVNDEEEYEDTIAVAKALKRLNEWKKEATRQGNDLLTLEIPIPIVNWIDKKMLEEKFERRSQMIVNILQEIMKLENEELP